jgi:hypothetical protein
MVFRTLDVEAPVDTQGFSPHSFDLVVAANVLHATRDLSTTLATVRSLLAPGGLVALLETTDHPVWLDVTTSLIAGWQRFDDRWRSGHPLLTPERWGDALAESGFVRAGAWPHRGSPAEILGQHVIVAQAPFQTALSTYATSAKRPAAASAVHPRADVSVRVSLAGLPEGDCIDALADLVRRHVAGVLRLSDDALVGRYDRLQDAGLDSLMAVELRNRVAQTLELTEGLEATLIFDHPSVDAIARYLGARLRGERSGPSSSPAGAPSHQPVASVGAPLDV